MTNQNTDINLSAGTIMDGMKKTSGYDGTDLDKSENVKRMSALMVKNVDATAVN